MDYIIPPYERNHAGEARKVGFELEFSDLEVEEAADIIADTYDGHVEKNSEVELEVSTTTMGTFTVELDWQLGKKIAEGRTGKSISAEKDTGDTLMQWAKWLAGQVVPVEIVCPPLEIRDLPQLDPMIDNLRRGGAKGTDESFIYAFGVHINPEIPDGDPTTIVRYLKAFALAQGWLFEKNGIDPVRRITPYIKPYSEDYIAHVLDYGDKTTLPQLIDDYLDYNHSRNRALDMTVLWKHFCPQRLKKHAYDDSMIRARPTFHYRLPNCEIEKQGWYLSTSWNIWCVVEYIAAHQDILDTLTARRQQSHSKKLFKTDRTWHNELEKIADDLLSE